MPSEIFKVTQITGRGDAETVTVKDLMRLITEINKMLAEIGVALGRTKGQDGAVSKFTNDIDMDGNAITNVQSVSFGARRHAQDKLPFVGEYLIDDPTDSPASADALRDDLADNIFPDIEAALNDLGLNLKRVLNVLQI